MENLEKIISAIGNLDAEAMATARARQDQLTKPRGSLGVLEEISVRIAGMRGDADLRLGKKKVVVMAGDHGITAEGTSAFPSEVTAQMVYNFARGGAAINVLAGHSGVDVVVVDIGVKEDLDVSGVRVCKVGYGTANMALGPAMSEVDAVKAIMVGVEIAEELVDGGVEILATGDMGIGSTSAGSAILAVLGDLELDSVIGRGTGIDDEGLAKKLSAIRRAIEVNKPDKNRPIDVLAKVGGYEIAGLAGVILGAAAGRTPVVIDGFISGAAALVAAKLAPKSVNYMIASHLSVEPGHRLVMAEVGLTPMLNMDMRLGEGTGAVLAMPIVEAAVRITNEMATFAEAGVSESQTEDEPVRG